MKYKEMFTPSLVQLAVEVKNKEETFLTTTQQLERMGYVSGNYLSGLIARERESPTGLITKYLNIMLSHPECEYVEKPFAFVMQLKNPIYFYRIGDNQETTVEDLFFLGIREPEEQVGLSQAFADLSMGETPVENCKKQKTPQNTYELIANYIQEEEKTKNRLIVVCGSGVATNQTIASKTQSMLEDNGTTLPIEAVDHRSIQNEPLTTGIYVYAAQPDEGALEQAKDLSIEVSPGIPFLIGMGIEPIYDSIKELVR